MATEVPPPLERPPIVVLISGNGSNLQAIIDAHDLPARIALVVSNRAAARGLARADSAGIPTLVRTLKAHRDRGLSRLDYDRDLANDIIDFLARSLRRPPALIVLAGFMHILSPLFLNLFPDGSVINLHPALPGAFDGANAIERAWSAFSNNQITHTGVMVHKVTPDLDRGQVVLQRSVPILPSDSLASLQSRIHDVEHQLIVDSIKLLLSPSPSPPPPPPSSPPPPPPPPSQ